MEGFRSGTLTRLVNISLVRLARDLAQSPEKPTSFINIRIRETDTVMVRGNSCGTSDNELSKSPEYAPRANADVRLALYLWWKE